MNFLKSNNNIVATINSTLNAPSTSNAYIVYIVLIIVIITVSIVTIYLTRTYILLFANKTIMNTKDFFSKVWTSLKKDSQNNQTNQSQNNANQSEPQYP